MARAPERFANPTAGGFFARFFAGARFAFDGVRYTLAHAELRSLAAVPIVINTILFTLLVWTGFSHFGELLDALSFTVSGTGWWASFLTFLADIWRVVVGTMLAVTFVIGGLLVTIILGNILAGPFYDALSERVEVRVLGRSHAPPFSIGQAFKDIFSEALFQLIRLMIYLSVVVLIFIIGAIVPVIGQVISSVLSTLWTWLFLSFEFQSPNLSRHQVRSDSRVTHIFNQKAGNLGFGAAAWLMLFIPFFAPTLVVGGTRYFLARAAYNAAPSKLGEADKVLLRQEDTLVALTEEEAARALPSS